MTCTCGHVRDEHEYSVIPVCTVEEDGERCRCIHYEWDGESED